MLTHKAVLLTEVIDLLNIKADGTYIDLTLGRGGHSQAILRRLTTGQLIAFDRDLTALKESAPLLAKIGSNFKLIHSDFKNFKSELAKLKLDHVDGIIADLGMSSPQIDDPLRGFSYQHDAKLDMRFDQSSSLSAYDVVNSYSEAELVTIFRDYADVKLPQRVAKGIIAKRPITTTLELVAVIRESLPAAIVRQKNPAKTVFQAIRIAVNNEVEALQAVLKDAPNLLNPGGALIFITFHSLEDRLVKYAFRPFIQDDTGQLPIKVVKKWAVKTLTPNAAEMAANSRSRSAKLRALIKLV